MGAYGGRITILASLLLNIIVVFQKGIVSLDAEKEQQSDLVYISNEEEEPPFTLGDLTYEGDGCPSGSVMSTPSPDNGQIAVIFSGYIATTDNDVLNDEKSCDLAVPVQVKQSYQLTIFKVEYRGFTFIPENRRQLKKKKKKTKKPKKPKTKKPKKKKKKKTKKPKKPKTKKPKNATPTFRPVGPPIGMPSRAPTPPTSSAERYSKLHVDYFLAGEKGQTFERKFTETIDPFFIEDSLKTVVVSECGDSPILRISSSIVANKGSASEPEIEIGLDSADITSPIDSSNSEIRYYVKATQC